MSATAPAPDLWDLLDAVLVLNLDQRPERWESLRAQARGLVPEGKLHRVPAVLGKALPGFGRPPWFRGRKRDTTWAARGGCVLAHRRALDLARAKGWSRVLILEDDVEFSPTFAALAAPLGARLAPGGDPWEICYLGYTDPQGPARTLAVLGAAPHRLAEVFGCNCAHAYVVSAAARDWLLARLPDETTIWPWLVRRRAVDRWYRRVLGARFRVLAVSPSAINQAAGFSDIVGKETLYQATGAHTLEVVATPTSDAAFATRRAARVFFNRILDFYDALRGFLKRLRGF
jgi:hypothetical protein